MPNWFKRRSDKAGDRRRIAYDEAAIRNSLRLAIDQALRSVAEAAPGEHVYGLSVYDGIEHGYICITPFTGEGLDRVLAAYREGPWAAHYEDDDAAEGLRWSAPDSPFHGIATVDSPPLVSGEDQYALWQSWDQDDGPLHEYRERVRELCITTLKEMDRDGRFAGSAPRLTLMLQDRDERERAQEVDAIRRRLNPK